MKLAIVFLIASQALAAPSSSEEDMDMRVFSSSEEDMDMRAFSSSEEASLESPQHNSCDSSWL